MIDRVQTIEGGVLQRPLYTDQEREVGSGLRSKGVDPEWIRIEHWRLSDVEPFHF